MSESLTRIDKNIHTYNDGRTRIQDLYQAYELLEKKHHWTIDKVATQEGKNGKNHPVRLSILNLRTPNPDPAFWCFFGIHGEEPAGPMAFVSSLEAIINLGKTVPIVIFPLCNPLGYVKDWRYENEKRDDDKGKSVGDSDHLLISHKSRDLQPRKPRPASPTTAAFTSFVLDLSKTYPGLISIDHHEDEDYSRKKKHRSVYIYTHGKLGTRDPAAQKAVAILRESGIPFILNGETRFREKIDNGIVIAHDGSIDELLSSEEIIIGGRKTAGPNFPTVIVIETPTRKTALSKRVSAHQNIIESYPLLLDLSRSPKI